MKRCSFSLRARSWRAASYLLPVLCLASFACPAHAAVGGDAVVDAFRGEWRSSVTYAAGSAVTYRGASYLCLVKNTAVAPNTNTGDWVLVVSPGAMGPAGAAGAPGPQGVPGPRGATGQKGPSGASGPAGPAGLAGARGSTGVQGPAGATGPIGAPGSGGPTGPAGSSGAAGMQGPQGPPGPPGLTEADTVPIVVDATGRFVASAPGHDYMQLNGDIVTADVISSGFFQDDSASAVFYHEAANCAGPRLLSSFDPLSPTMNIYNNIGYYAGEPLIVRTIRSVETFLEGEDVTKPSTHCAPPVNTPPPDDLFGPVKTVDINSLGFVPPFTFRLE
jgi:hypothetical protein